MPNRQLLLSALNEYQKKYETEKVVIQEMIDFIEKNPNCFERSNQTGHITGSAFLLSPDEKKVLLTHHKKLNRWLQLGGHSDGQHDTWNVALREAIEESGITAVQFMMNEIFDIDIHVIPENATKNEPEHKHYDVRFLLKSSTEDFVISEESIALKWVDLEELRTIGKKEKISKSILRMTGKFLERDI